MNRIKDHARFIRLEDSPFGGFTVKEDARALVGSISWRGDGEFCRVFESAIATFHKRPIFAWQPADVYCSLL